MEKMISRMEECSGHCEVVEMQHMCKSCASHIVILYAFDDSFHFLDRAGYFRPYFEAGEKFTGLADIYGMFSSLVRLAIPTPSWLVKMLNPPMREFVDSHEIISRHHSLWHSLRKA